MKILYKVILFIFLIYINVYIKLNNRNKNFEKIRIINREDESNKLKNGKLKKNEIKIALCTMVRGENLYIKEFIDYYLKLGINHIFIYDDNDPGTENILDILETKYLNNVTIYNTTSLFIKGQPDAYTKCYNNNINKFDWFLMVDTDEFLYIVNDSLKAYLNNEIFDKCDFIKFHWVLATDNGLLHYDNRSLFERFRPPYIPSTQVKTIIRGNISNLKYWVHSPYISPKRNITCDNEGKRIYYEKMNIQFLKSININKAYIIHFKYKSAEELVKKIKRGFKNWRSEKQNIYLFFCLIDFFKINNVTFQKINYIQKELNISFLNNII